VRESPALDVIELLREKGAIVAYHDPYVPSLSLNGHQMENTPLSDALLKEQDCVVITTNHSCFDMAKIAGAAALIVDSRNATRDHAGDNIVKL
jgi:UDP-N-acetyl-D-glucosamine dehydrogenase